MNGLRLKLFSFSVRGELVEPQKNTFARASYETIFRDIVDFQVKRDLFYHGEATPQVTPQVMQILQGIQEEMTRGELMAKVELKDRMHFSQAYLQPALEEDVIEMTIPDKPKSRFQKYRLTEKGGRLIGKAEGGNKGTKGI